MNVCVFAVGIRHVHRIPDKFRCVNVWPVWFCHIFVRHLINGTIFGKKNK